MVADKVVNEGYIKLLALNIGHLETEIIMERNTNSQYDINAFREKYENIKGVIIFVIHMDYDNDIMFSDYQKSMWRYSLFWLFTEFYEQENGKMVECNDIKNDELWNISRIKYVEYKIV